MQQQQPQPQGTEQLGVEPQQQLMGHQTSGTVPKGYQEKVLSQVPDYQNLSSQDQMSYRAKFNPKTRLALLRLMSNTSSQSPVSPTAVVLDTSQVSSGKQGSLYSYYSSSGYVTGNSSLSHSSSQTTLNDDYYSSYEDPEFEKRCKMHNNVKCLYQINEEFVVKCVGSMMQLIKYPENNAKVKVFDDTDGYRLPNLSMYKCANEYLHGIAETLRDPKQRAEMSKPDVVHNSTKFQKELSDEKTVSKAISRYDHKISNGYQIVS